MKTIRVFKYIDHLDCFVVNPSYKSIADYLGLTEWNEVVWIGRFFALDNDYGEHWFDNWELRDKLEVKAGEAGITYEELLVIDPDRFKDNRDGPVHSDEERKLFWTDVLRSLELSLDLLFHQARKQNRKKEGKEEYIEDLETRIAEIIRESELT
ncbi:hypothetical protein [Chitinophaga filiformis]|uniref:Uncharacterized protein n=1 Tax=Chitinophaga filiformis TaxID=104663 RepID=A0ABY4HZI8_CHIFI|nr:hypothetical protein [Chitinophaga filiformis]UPK68348.1 hypothetical protein MYF79_25670 [Chitinophaga filiformis]